MSLVRTKFSTEESDTTILSSLAEGNCGRCQRSCSAGSSKIKISLKAPGVVFVGDLCSAVKRRKQELFVVKRRKQYHKFRISVYGLYVSKTTFLNRIPVLEKRVFTRAQNAPAVLTKTPPHHAPRTHNRTLRIIQN